MRESKSRIRYAKVSAFFNSLHCLLSFIPLFSLVRLPHSKRGREKEKEKEEAGNCCRLNSCCYCGGGRRGKVVNLSNCGLLNGLGGRPKVGVKGKFGRLNSILFCACPRSEIFAWWDDFECSTFWQPQSLGARAAAMPRAINSCNYSSVQ